MFTMRVSVRGDKTKGENPRRVVVRKIFVGPTEEGVADAFNKWRNEAGHCWKRFSLESWTIKNGRDVPSSTVSPNDGKLRRIADMRLEPVNAMGGN